MIMQCLSVKAMYSVCNGPSAVNDTADTVRRRKACQSDVVAKVALLLLC